jgi:hypothetical protein
MQERHSRHAVPLAKARAQYADGLERENHGLRAAWLGADLLNSGLPELLLRFDSPDPLGLSDVTLL